MSNGVGTFCRILRRGHREVEQKSQVGGRLRTEPDDREYRPPMTELGRTIMDPANGSPAVFKTVCGLRDECTEPPAGRFNCSQKPRNGLDRVHAGRTVTVVRYLTAACSTVELLRNGSPEF